MLKDKKYISIRFDESQLKERNKALSTLQEMSSLLDSSTDITKLLQGSLKLVLDNFDLEAGRIYLLTQDSSQLILAAHSGIAVAGLEKMGLHEGFSGKAARTKSFIAQYVSELEDQHRKKLLESKGFKIVICVPMIAMDKMVGVMNLATRRTFGLDSNKIDLFNVIGSQMAAAIENVRLYNDLQEKLQRLDERNEMIKLFAYSIAHDLKSPAIGIHGFSRRLKEKYGVTLDQKGKQYCEEIMKLAEHMITLLEEMNSYIAIKEIHPCFERLHLTEITHSIKSEFQARLKSHHAHLWEPAADPEIIADRTSLLRALRNLVDNALKYGGEDLQAITIDYNQNESFHLLSVRDDGKGIEPQETDKVFNAFQRNHTSQGTVGTGLGLAIVKEVAKKHGGSAWITPGTRKGTLLTISIARNLTVTEEQTEPPEDTPRAFASL
jgi:K+-sensing histidine kinase KdpD